MARKKRQRSGQAGGGRGSRSRSSDAGPADASPPGVAANPVACTLLAVLAFGLYANTIPNDYVLDDVLMITQNRFTSAGVAGIGDLMTTDSVAGYLGSAVDKLAGGRYRPLSLVTFAVEQSLFGPNPHISHALNALIYAACVVGVYLVLVSLLRDAPGERWFLSVPFVAALLFAAHPIHTEVVANIKGRDELLALLGALTTLWLCLRTLSQKGVGAPLVVGFVFFFALMSKENAVTFLAIVPISVWFFRPEELAGLRRVMPPLLVAALVFIALRQSIVVSTAVGGELLNDPFLGASIADKYATIFYTLGLYLKLLVYPHPLTHDYYPYHVPILSWSDWWPWFGLVANLVLAGIAIVGFRARWIASYGIAFYLVTLSIVSNLAFSIGTFMNERWLLMPSVGLCMLAAWILVEGSRRVISDRKARALVVSGILACALVPFAGLTIARNRVWKNNFTLATTDVKVSSGSAFGNRSAAASLIDAAREQQDRAARMSFAKRARTHLEKALQIYPEYDRALALLARVHLEFFDDVDRAIEYYERVVALHPQHRALASKIGTLLFVHRRERIDEAVRYFEIGVEAQPGNVEQIRNLGVAYLHQGDRRRAAETLERAVLLHPRDADLNLLLAQVLELLGDSEAFERYRRQAESLGADYESLDANDYPAAAPPGGSGEGAAAPADSGAENPEG